MDAVQKRVADRMAAERKQLHAEQMALGKQRQRVAKQVTQAVAAQKKLIDALMEGHAPKQADLDKGQTAHRSLGGLLRELYMINSRATEHSVTLARLDSKAETDRRLKLAHQFGLTEPVPGPEAAKIVLLHAGKPLAVKDISRQALDAGIVKLKGYTPEQTMSAYLSKAAKKGDTFVRIHPSVYDLKERVRV